jgi:predicted RNase H-like nuclease (RuvC/YqgF family)
MADKEKTCDLDYKAFYNKHREEIEFLKAKLMDSEERCRMLREEVAKLSSIKATVEVIFGRKFDG